MGGYTWPQVGQFTAAQAAQKTPTRDIEHGQRFTAAQAAQKVKIANRALNLRFTAAQAAQKCDSAVSVEAFVFTAAQAAQKSGYVSISDGSGVHCRTGSSENRGRRSHWPGRVHCRTGSSEILACAGAGDDVRSLPHRQLRNEMLSTCHSVWGSLPHRQLRKLPRSFTGSRSRSLPHRQLRKWR